MSVEIYTPQETSGINIFNQRLAKKLESHHFDPSNTRLSLGWFEGQAKYRQFHENLCQYLKEYQIDQEFQDFINLLIHYVESYHYLVALKLDEIHYSKPTQEIVDYYYTHHQKEALKSILKKVRIFIINYPNINELYLPNYGFGKGGVLTTIISLDNIEVAKVVCQENRMNFPDQLRDAFYNLIDLQYCSKEECAHKEKYSIFDCKKIIEEYSDNYFSEIIYFNSLVFEKIKEKHIAFDPRTRFTWFSSAIVEKSISFILDQSIEKNDEKLYQPKVMVYLLRYFNTIVESDAISRYDFIKMIAKYIPMAYKKNLLTAEIIEALEHKLKFDEIYSSALPPKKSEQLQTKIKDIIADFKQKQTLNKTGQDENQFIFDNYQLPFSSISGSVSIFMGGNQQKIRWIDHFQAEFDALQGKEKADWLALWQHIDSTTAKKPTQKWLKEAEKIFNTSVKNSYQDNLIRWVDLIINPNLV